MRFGVRLPRVAAVKRPYPGLSSRCPFGAQGRTSGWRQGRVSALVSIDRHWLGLRWTSKMHNQETGVCNINLPIAIEIID